MKIFCVFDSHTGDLIRIFSAEKEANEFVYFMIKVNGGGVFGRYYVQERVVE